MTQEGPIEKVIREYFEDFAGRSAKKLDTGKKRAADFRVSDSDICFLCEVKTVKFVRANFSSSPLDYHLEQRKKRQVVLMSIGEEAVLTTLARSNAKLGLIFLDMKRAAGDLSKLV